MAYQRDTFRNPANGATYAWPINHSEEAQFGKRRNITVGANTASTGLTLQQGDDEPMTIELSGTILHHSQHVSFINWFALSRLQTIYFADFIGETYEVIILEYSPTRQRTLRNPRDSSIPLHFWRYTMRMHVVAFLAAPWNAVTP